MHIFQVFDAVRRRPGIYLDGEKSLPRLRSFILGRDGGLGFCGVQLEGVEEMKTFEKWTAKQLGFENSITCGLCNVILSKTDSDEKAYDTFLDLLEKFAAPCRNASNNNQVSDTGLRVDRHQPPNTIGPVSQWQYGQPGLSPYPRQQPPGPNRQN